MAEKEIETELMRMGNDYAIPLPVTFCDGTTLQEGTRLKVIYNDRGNLEVQVNRVAPASAGCQHCSSGSAKYTCSLCGANTCSSCFWEWGGLCNKCMKK